ncbi:MAG TPA: efflux RND transporter periplasmic adaptor subunit [Paracoccaceae bacterium]|nr:efflux RND transporter periplasmic adaptor subunit [Paracoccaceae bacterium]
MPPSSSSRDGTRTRPAVALAAALACVAALIASAMLGSAALAQGAPGAGAEAPPVPVTVVVVEPQDVTLTARLPGRIVASRMAEVRPQVNGLIVDRLFDEGAQVELGEPLYQIDAASYEATVAMANAEIAQAEARLTAADKALARARELVGREVVSEQTLDQAIADRDSAAAALDVAEARLHSAQIDLNRTTIRAPLSGMIGRSLTTQGALVTAGQAQPLAIIRTLDPVLVDVTQSAAEIVKWRRKEAAAELAGADPTVTLILADGKTYAHTGQLTAAEPHVDEQTGVVTLRMQFPNPDHLLLPGMYAEVEMPQGVAEEAILAPMQGVARDRRGRPTALVVNADNVVESRDLTVIGSRGPDWIVTEGLEAGDRLIIEGLQKIQPGAVVAPEVRAEPEPPEPDDEAEQRASLPQR